MAATYNTALTNPVHQLRHVLGDVDVPANAFMTDEEYAYEYAAASNSLTSAALSAARRLQARFAFLVDKTEGDVSVKNSQLAGQFSKLADDLADQIAGSGGGAAPPYAGGISLSDRRARELNTDRPPNAFGQTVGSAYPYGSRSPWGW